MKNFKWDKKYLYWGVTAFCTGVAIIIFFQMLSKWDGFVKLLKTLVQVLSPVIYGILIAYILNKAVKLLEKAMFTRLSKKMFPKNEKRAAKASRIMAIILAMLLACGVVTGLVLIILPQIFYSVVDLVNKSSDYLEIVVDWADGFLKGHETIEPVVLKWLSTSSEYLMNWIETGVLPRITTLITGITGGVISIIKAGINILMGAVISIYLMYNKELFAAQGKKIIYGIFKPKTANKFMEELDFVNKAFGDYIAGTIIDAVVVGVVNYIFMLIAGMPYAALISIIVALTNIIPVFGPIIGAVPSALLLLLENPAQSLIFIIFTVILQQIDGNIVKPKIHGSKSGISGFWIMLAIVFFGGLFGLVGMLFGVPIMTVLYSAVKRLNAKKLLSRGLPSDTDMYRGMKKVDPETNEFIYRTVKAAPEKEPESEETKPEAEK